MPPRLEADLARLKARPKPAPRGDIAVVFWCDWKDPVNTLKHQVYDVRKGEYTSAVDEWMTRISRDYPRYVVFRREANLDGRDRADVVGEVVGAERKRLEAAMFTIAQSMAEAAAVSARSMATPISNAQAGRPPRAVDGRGEPPGSGGSSGFASRPGGAPALFPTPMPRPRPVP